jgi:hypothetical protein
MKYEERSLDVLIVKEDKSLRDGCINYSELITNQSIHESTHHIAPHKPV